MYTVLKQQADICQLQLLFVRFDLGEGSQCQPITSSTDTYTTMSDHIEVETQRFCGSLQPTNRSQYFAPPAMQPYRIRTVRFDRPQLDIYFEGRYGAGYGFQLRGKQVSCVHETAAMLPNRVDPNRGQSHGSTHPGQYTAHLEEITDRPNPVHISQPDNAPTVRHHYGSADARNHTSSMSTRNDRLSTNFLLPSNERTLLRPDPPTSGREPVLLSPAERDAFGHQNPVLIESPKSDHPVPVISVRGTYNVRPNSTNRPPIRENHSPMIHEDRHSSPAPHHFVSDKPEERLVPNDYAKPHELPEPALRNDGNANANENFGNNTRANDSPRSSVGYGSVQITSNRNSNDDRSQNLHLQLNDPPLPINRTNVHVYIPAAPTPIVIHPTSGRSSSALSSSPLNPPPTHPVRNETNRFNITNYQVIGWQPNPRDHESSTSASSSFASPASSRSRSFGLASPVGGYCDQMLDVSNFQLRSPNHPHAYPPQLFCTYVLRRQSVQICAIELTFIHFELPETRDCNGTYFDVDGGRICGRLPTYHQRKCNPFSCLQTHKRQEAFEKHFAIQVTRL